MKIIFPLVKCVQFIRLVLDKQNLLMFKQDTCRRSCVRIIPLNILRISILHISIFCLVSSTWSVGTWKNFSIWWDEILLSFFLLVFQISYEKSRFIVEYGQRENALAQNSVFLKIRDKGCNCSGGCKGFPELHSVPVREATKAALRGYQSVYDLLSLEILLVCGFFVVVLCLFFLFFLFLLKPFHNIRDWED